MGTGAASGRRGAEHDVPLRAARANVQRLACRSSARGELALGDHPGGARGLDVGDPRQRPGSGQQGLPGHPVRLFLEEQWQDGLAGLPRTAVIHVGEVPHNRSRRLPRGIEAPVFDQFIDPANLALLPSEQHRTVILLLAFTGLRVSSIVTLPRDALVIGSDNHPYLRYRQRQAAARGDHPDRPRARRAASLPREEPDRDLRAGRHQLPAALPTEGEERRGARRWASHRAADGPADRQVLRAQSGDPRQSRSAGGLGAPAPVPSPPRLEHGQRGRATVGDPAGTRSRVDRDDGALRPSR